MSSTSCSKQLRHCQGWDGFDPVWVCDGAQNLCLFKGSRGEARNAVAGVAGVAGAARLEREQSTGSPDCESKSLGCNWHGVGPFVAWDGLRSLQGWAERDPAQVLHKQSG